MKIGVVTMMYNEEMLAPLFLKHYDFADEIHVIYVTDSTDNTKVILEQSKAILHSITFPDMMDAGIKQSVLNHIFSDLKTDWGIMVDADEFVFPPDGVFSAKTYFKTLPEYIENISAWMWNVYRHFTEKDIDINKPPKYQRRHGDPNFKDWYNRHYIKRCIVKPKLKPDFNIGCHDFHIDELTPYKFHGVHWKMADPELAIIRRIKNGRDRQSKMNHEMNWQCHDFNITEEQIRAECKAHENDPLLL
jgi:hypothetical protein